MLTKEKPARERIILIGSFGAGKSNAWCTVAAWLRRTKSPARVFVVDTDHAADRLAEGYDDFYANVEAVSTWEYNEVMQALDSFNKQKPTKEDWLVVDLADKLWKYVQEHYIEKRYGKDAATYFLEFKAGGGTGHALSQEAYGADWQVINQLYAAMMTKIMRWPGHVLFCTPADPVERPNSQGKGGDDKDTIAMFGRHSVKPAGQKSLGFQFFTVLWMIPKDGDKWVFTSIKDVNRERPQNQPITDFVMDYLVKIGGWKV